MTGEAASSDHSASRATAALPKRGIVDVWRTNVSWDEAEIAVLERTLAPDERAFAALLRLPAARARFVATRAALRRLLGEYLGCEPGAVELRISPQGKPELKTRAATGVHFNVSHSGDLALLAFSSDSPVGVDVERERARTDVASLSSRFFVPEEQAAVMAAPPAERLQAFLAVWTAKEALLKARGDGLGGLEEVRVALGPEGAAAAQPTRRGEDGQAWHVRTLTPAPGYVGALAARSLPHDLRLRTLASGRGPAGRASTDAY